MRFHGGTISLFAEALCLKLTLLIHVDDKGMHWIKL